MGATGFTLPGAQQEVTCDGGSIVWPPRGHPSWSKQVSGPCVTNPERPVVQMVFYSAPHLSLAPGSV